MYMYVLFSYVSNSTVRQIIGVISSYDTHSLFVAIMLQNGGASCKQKAEA